MKTRFTTLGLLFLVLLAPIASAADFTEDFESFALGGFTSQTKPDQDWYDYFEGSNIGEVSQDAPIIEGTQSFRVRASATGGSIGGRHTTFSLAEPIQLTALEFFIEGVNQTAQHVSIQSENPVRTMVEFYILCNVDTTAFCELKVRFDTADTTGQTLVNTTANQTQFKVRVVPNWQTAQYRLFVDDVDDGLFPFLQLPNNIGRLRIAQTENVWPIDVSFDSWTIEGAADEAPEALTGDAATGLKNFATDIRFTASSSKFLLGIVFLIIMTAAVVVPLVTVGKSTTVLPAIGTLLVLIGLWLIELEFWPDWIGILMIIVVSAMTGLLVRRFILGIRDSNTGPSLVAGALGYFIIASAFLAFSGYAQFDIELPTNPTELDPDDTEGLPDNETYKQPWVEAILDCSIAIVSFGFGGDCTRETRGSVVTFVAETANSIGRVAAMIFSFAQVAFIYLFQLLTFQLPIPLIFNVMIVFPPAASLATFGLQLIRGSGS